MRMNFKEDLLFNHELANLKQAGITVADLTGEEIVALVHAVDKLKEPFSAVNRDVVGMPIRVNGGVTLWKMTVGATVWLAEYARKWWLEKGYEDEYFWAVVYACVHSREPKAFSKLTDEFEAHTAITEMAVEMAAYKADLIEGVNKCFEIRESKTKRKTPDGTPAPESVEQTDWASIIARLEGQTGIPAEKWCWQRSADYALRVHEDLDRFAVIAMGGKAGHMRDENDMATSELAKLRESILNRVQAERGETK